MANSRTKRISVASGPNYGPGRSVANPHQRKVSVVNASNARVPDVPIAKKQLNWDSPTQKPSGICADKMKIISILILGGSALLLGVIFAVTSFVIWNNKILEIVGPCLIGVGAVLCILGGFSLAKKTRGSNQGEDCNKEGEDGGGYIDPTLRNVSLAEIKEEAAPDECELYEESGYKQTTSTGANVKTKSVNDVVKDFDSDTVPGMVPLPNVAVGETDLNAPMVAYPNIPRGEGDIKMASATYKVPMATKADI
ncbi:uncharacterized protein [Ptychodera flava]|uniref:uncharacterized protein n=1 Tax=Ptychodera flava TaxID=63121 RepID=UPI00396A67F1